MNKVMKTKKLKFSKGGENDLSTWVTIGSIQNVDTGEILPAEALDEMYEMIARRMRKQEEIENEKGDKETKLTLSAMEGRLEIKEKKNE